jgi:intracellular septation protein
MKNATVAKATPGWLPMALDYVPLILFFVVYKFAGIIAGTAVFMVAIVAAIVVSKWKLGHVTPMMWLSAILVVGFGALTIYFNDQKFIQIKPTIIYVMLGALLIGGLMRGKALLKFVIGPAFTELDDRGWILLSRNWGLFFFALAGMNEVLRAVTSFDTWLTVKVWGIPILSMAFVMANMPMLLKHGLGGEEALAEKG